MIDDHRHRILHAAARVYAQHGWRGATTRRIAEEAGVNEVTLFRQFGSKDALLDLMLQEAGRIDAAATLPRDPEDPEAELLRWLSAHHRTLRSIRTLMQQMMSDALERPDAAMCASQGPSVAAAALREYVVQLRRRGLLLQPELVSPTEVGAAVTMLMGALFSDAIHRDLMPDMFAQSVEDSLRAYVRIFLRGLGVPPTTVAADAQGDRLSTSTASSTPVSE
ncbi:MAG: TetR/AcrR family transcriptional regulator [Gemmatimonadetes bacterium]|nr:TetR/AcrR family transcriptional regulator [Gemmatimonadota bacterium]